MSPKRISRTARVALAMPHSSIGVRRRLTDRDDLTMPYPLRWDRYAASRMHDFGQR